MPSTYTWLLSTPPTPSPAAPGESASTVGAAAIFTRKCGILTPFRRDQKNDFANGGGRALIRSHIQQILGVRAGNEVIQGEYAWRSSFGSLLELVRHRHNDPTTRELARSYVIDAISRWTRAVRITDVDLVTMDASPNTLILRVWYEVTANGIREADVIDVDLAALAR